MSLMLLTGVWSIWVIISPPAGYSIPSIVMVCSDAKSLDLNAGPLSITSTIKAPLVVSSKLFALAKLDVREVPLIPR